MQKNIKTSIGEYPIFGASGLIKHIDFYMQSKHYIAVVKDGAGVGRTMLLPAYSSVIGTLVVLSPKSNIDIKFLYYAISNMNLGKYRTGATIPHIYFKDYKKERLLLPDIEKQIKVAAILTTLDEILLLKKQQITKLDILIKSKFLEIFGDPVVNKKNWEIAKLSSLGTLERGKSKHRPRNDPILLGGQYPLIQTGDIAKSGVYLFDYNETYSEEGLMQSKLWPKETLCITIAANIAKTSILTFDSCFPDSIVGFLSNGKVTNIFIHYWFSFFQKILEDQAPESAQKNINLKILKNLDIIHPPIQLQTKFTEFVDQVEKTKREIEKSIEQLEILKKSLMQKYFG